ncbi:unnamed protein product [Notodromas monacha]|uniref:Attractin n=1 Tax=Notodromas monacha TaxID=399045 RepID=A0A7R9BMA3_9CRUS|nr:unnamed protein product [Notodromas monacha]CAG0917287.1 unnamed protein product [Notodromas monacha]
MTGHRAASFQPLLLRIVNLTIFAALVFLGSSASDSEFLREKRSALTIAQPAPSEKDCYNGDVLNGTCSCRAGWRGDSCGSCHGRTRLTADSGVITHGFGNYTFNQRCSWLIDGGGPGNVILLRFQHFETECCWDHVYVFDGDGVNSELVGVFSGLLVNQDESDDPRKMPEFVTKSGFAFVHFYSDVAYNLTGFNISYSLNACPRGISNKNCSGRGACVKGTCTCDAGYKGAACDYQICPNSCSQHGTCDEERQICICDQGYKGHDCSQHEDDGVWEWEGTGSFLPSGRASHSAVVYGDSLYIIGGEDFKDDNVDVNPQFIVRFDLTGKVWETVHSVKERPTWRYGHTAVMHGDKIYVYGGMLEDGSVVDALWTFDSTSRDWERVQVLIGECSGLCGPLPVVGHTAVTIPDFEVMLVFFGHSPVFGYLNNVQVYHFGSARWSLVETRGALVSGGYGATSVYDSENGLVYVHGGHITSSGGAYGSSASIGSVSDALLQYNHALKEWTIKKPSGYPRYLHSAVLLNGAMLVVGGNVHNDTDTSHGAKCYSGHALVYDPKCDRWTTLDTRAAYKHPGGALARFGHSASVFNGSMYLFGGFSGNMHNDVIKFTPGRCEAVVTREDCYSGRIGRSCSWQSNRVGCVSTDGGGGGGGGGGSGSGVTASRVRRHRHDRSNGSPSYDNLCAKIEDSSPAWINMTRVCSALKNCESCMHTSLGCVHCAQSAGADANPASELDIEDFEVRPSRGFCSYQACPSRATETNELESHGQERCQNPDAESAALACTSRTSCHACITKSPSCLWQITKEKGGVCRARKNPPEVPRGSVVTIPPGLALNDMCGMPCHEWTNCGNCTKSRCMWCASLGRCLDSNAYIAAFPYGQCMNWTMHHFECPDVRYASRWIGQDIPDTNNAVKVPENKDVCRYLSTCEECQEWPECGWCDNGTGTGLGQCMRGGNSAPYSKICPRGLWFFTECPTCQCNGHSTCVNNTDVCQLPCQDQTTGDHCERCIEGYFGNPVNGGNCSRCECNGHGTWCDRMTGKCVCTTKGIVGDKCDRCDYQNKYFGNPLNGGTCFYKLTIDYQFTFNMSKPDDRNLTQINFMNTPPQIDVDTEFLISCSENATISISFLRKSGDDGTGGETEAMIHQGITCPNAGEKFEAYFAADKYIFGNPALNTTFRVYVYDFRPPIMIRVAFSQHHRMNLPYFFVTFSLCFLALLATAAVAWKIKQKFDMYRRRQRLYVEMEAMASRPCAQVVLEVERRATTVCGCGGGGGGGGESDGAAGMTVTVVANGGNMADLCVAAPCHCTINANRRNKGQPSPIALEPCFGGKAAVLTLMVQLPTGGSHVAPPNADGTLFLLEIAFNRFRNNALIASLTRFFAGLLEFDLKRFHSAGICVGSALVSLGSPRKASGSGTGDALGASSASGAAGLGKHGEVGLLFRATRGFVRPKPPPPPPPSNGGGGASATMTIAVDAYGARPATTTAPSPSNDSYV